MDEHTRRGVAYIAGCLATGQTSSRVCVNPAADTPR